MRAGGAFGDLLGAVAQVPDAVLLTLRIDIDDRDFFRRHVRHGAARLHKEAQPAMLAAANVRVEKAWLFGIVKIRQRAGFHVSHGVFGEANIAPEFLQNLRRMGVGGDGAPAAADFLVGVVGKAQHELPEVLLDGFLVEETLQLLGFGPVDGFESELALAHEHSQRDFAQDRRAEGERPALQSDDSSVSCQHDVFSRIRFGELGVAQLAVVRIGIGAGARLAAHARLLDDFGDFQPDFDCIRLICFYGNGLGVELETGVGNFDLV